MSDTLTCRRCGHRGDYHRHNDDLLDENCHDETGNYVCAHFRCLHPWTPRDFAPDPECDCSNFEPLAQQEGNRE